MTLKESSLFQDPQIDYPIDNLDLPFNEYIRQIRSIITQHRTDLKSQADLIIDANTPFELQPAQPLYSEKNPTKIKYGA
jgi:hypothetical protein